MRNDREGGVAYPTPALDREVQAIVRWAKLILLIVGIFVFAIIVGCQSPSAALIASDAEYYESIGREYEANLRAGHIHALRAAPFGASLSAEPVAGDDLEARLIQIEAWGEGVRVLRESSATATATAGPRR